VILINIQQGNLLTQNDTLAEKLPSGEWICGDCQIEELNKRKIMDLGLNHPDVKWFIQQEETKVKAYNNYAKRINQNMGVNMKYRKNKYTGKIPF